MSLIKTEGIVLRETKCGDHDKMLTVLTKDWGTVSVFARGVRGGKNRYVGAGLFCYSEFVLFKGTHTYQLNDCHLIRSFHRVVEDLDSLACASYLCEVAGKEQVENQELLRLLLNALSLLDDKSKELWLVKGAFELRAACVMGFAPAMSYCVRCGKEGDCTGFSVTGGGVICSSCCTSDGERVSKAVANAICYVGHAKNPFSFTLGKEYIKEFARLCESFLLYHLGKQPNTLAFLKSLLEINP